MSKTEAFFIVGDDAAAEINNVGEAMIKRINEMAEILVDTKMIGLTKEDALDLERRHGSPLATRPWSFYRITIEKVEENG